MTDQERQKFESRVADLEQEVRDRESDLNVFRRELEVANKKLEGLIDQIHQELKVAVAIQNVLVPTEFPNIQGFEFSSKFVPSVYSGGDYFDIFEHDDRARFGVIMASSSGHAMSALLLSVLLKLTGQMEARQGAEPYMIIKRMAQELIPNIRGEESADVFYSLIDRRNFELRYSLAGKVVALIQQYGSGELKLLKPSTGPLQPDYKVVESSESVPLNPRDRVILCTRGIIEASDMEGENFGQERLYQTILEAPRRGVHELRNQILFKVQKFSGGQQPRRDLTVVVMEVKDRVIKLAKS